jgi:hypothetical protein
MAHRTRNATHRWTDKEIKQRVNMLTPANADPIVLLMIEMRNEVEGEYGQLMADWDALSVDYGLMEAENAKLQAEVERLQSICDYHDAHYNNILNSERRLYAENAKLRGFVKTMAYEGYTAAIFLMEEINATK